MIGDKISITVVRIAPGIVRIGVEAPDDLPILREELTTGSQLPVDPLGLETRVALRQSAAIIGPIGGKTGGGGWNAIRVRKFRNAQAFHAPCRRGAPNRVSLSGREGRLGPLEQGHHVVAFLHLGNTGGKGASVLAAVRKLAGRHHEALGNHCRIAQADQRQEQGKTTRSIVPGNIHVAEVCG